MKIKAIKDVNENGLEIKKGQIFEVIRKEYCRYLVKNNDAFITIPINYIEELK